MKIREIDSSIKVSDLENMFNIFYGPRGYYMYNLNETVYIDENCPLNTYITDCACFWPLISYKLYDTTHLAWLLMKVNKVDGKNIFRRIEPGRKIKYPSVDAVLEILKLIRS